MMVDIWTKGRLEATAGKSTTAMTRMVERFERAAVPPDKGPTGARAWGQYLDDEHHSDRQWGFYGTCAAINTLTIKELKKADPRPADDPLIQSGLKSLPRDPTTTEAHFDSKREKGDFDNIIKLAFIADGLEPWRTDVPEADTPKVVDQILDRSVNDRFWSSRLENDPARQHKERLFPTAYVVMVLQRFEKARRHDAYKEARKWLADRIGDEKINTPSTNALIGLALLDPHEKKANRTGEIETALNRCQERLIQWGRGQKVITIDRPVFYGFSLGDRNSYSFLNPELLAALFLLKRNNPRRGRRFVLRVIDALADNTANAGGFIGQNGVMSAVDQMWATRLLGRFLSLKDEPNGTTRLLPVRDQRAFLVDSRSRIVAVLALIAAALGVVLLTDDGSFWRSFGVWFVAVVMLFANVFAMPGSDNEV